MRLSSLIVQDTPSETVRLCVEEAGRCYLFGFWRSAIALSRAALESALREQLERSGISDMRDLKDLISAASKLQLLDAPHVQFASVLVQCEMERGRSPLESITRASTDRMRRCLLRARGALKTATGFKED